MLGVGGRAALAALLLALAAPADQRLVIYVMNQGGDIMTQIITANVTENIVNLQFLRSDGIHIQQVIDFTHEVQVLKVIVPGEEELGWSECQVMCFVTHADKNEFIAADAMVKLRQKNPGTIRMAEEDKGSVTLPMTAWLANVLRAFSPYASEICAEAGDQVYTRHSDINKWLGDTAQENSWLVRAITPFPPTTLESSPDPDTKHISTCAVERDVEKECICHFEVCIGWYPCGLKYCKGKPQPNVPMQNLSYRCGIKTCRKCQKFEYYVHRKQQCLWGE